jgi:hypothetical protein
MSPNRIELSRQAENALQLVSERYFVKTWQILELAPLLFCWAAEMSLRQRRERLGELERACERARSLESEMWHLPVPNFTYSEEKIAAEADSIASNDIFGMCIDDVVFMPPEDPSHGNPFAVFLGKVVDDLGDVATFEEFSPIDYPIYHVCPQEASRFVGGDEALAREILSGRVILSEMPKELRGLFTKDDDRAAWVRAKAEEYRNKLFDSV